MCEHDTIAVEYQPAVGYHWHDGNAVLLRERVVVLVLDDLDVEKPHEQQEEREQYGAAHYRQAQLEVVQLALVIA